MEPSGTKFDAESQLIVNADGDASTQIAINGWYIEHKISDGSYGFARHEAMVVM